MRKGILARMGRLVTTMVAVAATMAVAASAASATEVIYNDLPAPTPGNVTSLGFEATQTAEFGGQVQVAGTARTNPIVTVMMSSWACQSGTWTAKNCTSAPKSKFEWPITFHIYQVDPGDTVGPQIAAGSKVFRLPYRPSANATKCTGENAGKWYHSGTCFNGKAFKITLPLKVASLPEKVIVTVAYNTSDYGAEPQRPKPCDAEEQGCPYDSLNVGLQEEESAPSVGSFPAPDIAYVNGAPEAGWTGFQPLFEIKAH